MKRNISKIEEFHQERRVNQLINEGYSNQKIADTLNEEIPEMEISHSAVRRFRRKSFTDTSSDDILSLDLLIDRYNKAYSETLKHCDNKNIIRDIWQPFRAVLNQVVTTGNDRLQDIEEKQRLSLNLLNTDFIRFVYDPLKDKIMSVSDATTRQEIGEMNRKNYLKFIEEQKREGRMG